MCGKLGLISGVFFVCLFFNATGRWAGELRMYGGMIRMISKEGNEDTG